MFCKNLKAINKKVNVNEIILYLHNLLLHQPMTFEHFPSQALTHSISLSWQVTWGVFDRENTVRRAMADSLSECAAIFYPRWKESEAIHAHLMQFSLDESQWQQDWAILLSLASQPGSSLEQLHIFALSHVLRRPIIVYGVKYVKSFRGETIGFARFEGKAIYSQSNFVYIMSCHSYLQISLVNGP